MTMQNTTDLGQNDPFPSETAHLLYTPENEPRAIDYSDARILVIEARRTVLALLKSEPKYRKFHIDSLPASEVELTTAHNRYTIVILDVDIHHRNGVALLRRLRHDRSVLPILALTASTAVHERVELLQAGADDCLAKPFASAEFFARIEVLLRRSRIMFPTSVTVGNLTLYRTERRVQRNQRSIALTLKEFAVLDLLMQNAGETIPKTTILQEVWKISESPTNVVEVCMNYLRGKLASPGEANLIRTIRGVGYQLVLT